MAHELPKLQFSYDALEPFMDAKTIEIHYTKHHQAYLDNLNKALAKHPELAEKPVDELLDDINKIPEDIKQAVINHGGGYWNHSFFWSILKKDTLPKGELLQAIDNDLGSFSDFKEQFRNAALTQFGSGWAWLVLNKEQKLEIMKTSNQDNPISQGKIPLLVIDVWEHAYYLKYKNLRADYIDNFFEIINWDQVAKYYEEAKNEKQ
jgi:superoxide dismutase, Fe-Mn family